MKRIIAAILVLCHVNSSMFLPQVQENDLYTVSGQQVDDINSLVELFNVQMGYDKTPDDEDSDDGQNFHLVKFAEYSFEQQSILVEREDLQSSAKHEFSEYKMPLLSPVCLDTPTPPPDIS